MLNKVSVIIPCTDRVEGLERCLKSVLSQNYKGELEIKLIENNSSDKFKVSRLVAHLNDYRITHVYMLNCANANVARNFGADITDAIYIAYLDSDDWWEINHISSNIALATRFNNKATYSGFILNDGISQIINSSFPIDNITPYKFLFGEKPGVAQTSSYFLHKSVLIVCRWDESLRRSQDYDFFINVQNKIGWSFNPCITVNVFWDIRSQRTLSVEAFRIFYSKHAEYMSSIEKATYLYEILRALSSFSTEGFYEFVSIISPYRSKLPLWKRVLTYNPTLMNIFLKLRIKLLHQWKN